MTQPMNVLFLNHKIENCGVYQYGLRIKYILKKSIDIKYIYIEIDSLNEYENVIKNNENLKCIIYNYCTLTMPWLNKTTLNNSIKSIGLLHPGSDRFFNVNCDLCLTSDSLNNYSIPRPLFNVDEMVNESFVSAQSEFINAHTDKNLPIFGSFGLAASYKGFDRMIHLINSQYDECIIKIVMPQAAFYPKDYCTKEFMKCKAVPVKPGIIVMISTEFFSNEDILMFLKKNTMNMFLYDTMYHPTAGISSVLDVALSVKTPIGITNSYMFRNVYNDCISLNNNRIKDCIKMSFEYCNTIRNTIYSHDEFLKKLYSLINIAISK